MKPHPQPLSRWERGENLSLQTLSYQERVPPFMAGGEA
jgi:hypothetical protein